jgi:uncharacterized protein (DUF58 family)
VHADRRYPTAVLFAAAFLAAGLYGRSSSLLLLSVPLLVYAASHLLSHALLRRPLLDATRSLSSGRIVEGDAVDVTLSVTNQGHAVACAAVLDEIPESATIVDGEASFCGPLKSGGGIAIKYRLLAGRGLHEQRSVRAWVWARFGLSLEEYRFECPTFVSVLPLIEKLPRMAIRPRKTHAFVGPVRARAAGPGVELFGSRAYAPGDDVRRLNWRAFARHGRLFINEYEQERMTDVIVILDVRASVHVREGGKSTFEPCCRAAASLAAHFVREGNRVGFLMYGRFLDWIQPAGGRFHLEKILASLAKARPARSDAFQDLAQLPIQLLPSGSQIVVVSPMSRTGDAMVAVKLRARGYSVLVMYADSLELERESRPDDPALALALRIRQLEMQIDFQVMESLGVHVVPWNVRQSLGSAIRAARLDQAERRIH